MCLAPMFACMYACLLVLLQLQNHRTAIDASGVNRFVFIIQLLYTSIPLLFHILALPAELSVNHDNTYIK